MRDISMNSREEFVRDVALDCLDKMSEKDKAYIMDNPYTLDYHFGYALYIRNKYIHCRDISKLGYYVHPDDLSSEIMDYIIAQLIPDEYKIDDDYLETVFNERRFIILRKKFKELYNRYPVDLIEKHRVITDCISIREAKRKIHEDDDLTDEEIDKIVENQKNNWGIMREATNSLVHELAELVWDTDSIFERAKTYDLNIDVFSERIQYLKDLFYKEADYLPMDSVFVLYKNQIDKNVYYESRNILKKAVKEDPWLVMKLGSEYFEDPVMARVALLQGYNLQYLPKYQNDDKMIFYAIGKDGTALEYADKRFQKDRDMVIRAIRHSSDKTIMYCDCMKPYRKDKDLVYLACEIEGWNYTFVDKKFHDDYELTKLAIINSPNQSVFHYLSRRLKDDLSLALLDIECDSPDIHEYSKRLRDSDEIAERLLEIHPDDEWRLHYMSKRIQKKYGIEE